MEDVIGIDDCSEEVGESFCLRITTKKGHRQASFLSSPHTEKRNKIYILRMQTREEHVSWLEALVSVFTVVNNSMRSFSKSTEVDGTILLTVIVPTLQESKRIKVDPKIDLAKLKRLIISKFKKVNNNDFESAAHQLGKKDENAIFTIIQSRIRSGYLLGRSTWTISELQFRKF